MDEDKSTIDWDALGRRLGLDRAERFVDQDIIPLIQTVAVEQTDKKGQHKTGLQLPFTLGMIGFGLSFLTLMGLTSDTFLGGLINFVLFLPLFFGWMILIVYLFKGRFFAAFVAGKERFLARSKALTALADQIGLHYVPSPGGAPAMLKQVAQHPIAPSVLHDVVELIDDHGGMDDALDIARASGVMMLGAVLGSKEQREKYQQQAAENVRVEDGFQGERDGVPFSAFEWVESEEDSPDTYHLVLVFQVPYRLQSVTQMRTRHIGWPGGHFDARFEPVDIVARAFRDRFRMRSSDQTEARTIFDPAVVERVSDLAHGDKVRAVAFDEHLVIDIEGDDRFCMVNLATGAWSRETIAASMGHIAEMLELADAVSNAFRLKQKPS